MRRTFTRKRLLLFLLALLVGGAIINVAVAWGCLYALPERHSRSLAGPSFQQPTTEATNRSVLDRVNAGVSFDSVSTHGLAQTRFAWIRTRVTCYGRKPGANPMFLTIEATFAGWPMRSLLGWYEWDERRPDRNKEQYSGLASNPLVKSADVRWVKRWIPLYPIWSGFAINTIFYAAVLWMLFAVPGPVRRRIGGVRIKRGQCAACGYSLRENTSEKCPECGASR